MLSVISPAKKLDYEQPPKVNDHTTPDFLGDSRKLNKLLRDYSELDLMELMGISRNIATLNLDRNLKWKTPFKPANAKQSLFAFRGDVYRGLDADNLNKNDVKFAQKHLRILSGLYGLLRPLDLMQAYRLEMGTQLVNERGKNLYEFWGSKVTDKLNEELASHKSRVLVNLASNEYFKVVTPKQLEVDLVTPVFKEKKGKDYRVVAIHAKRARGLMCRFIIKERIDTPEGLKDFGLEDYRFNKKLSKDANLVFTRG